MTEEKNRQMMGCLFFTDTNHQSADGAWFDEGVSVDEDFSSLDEAEDFGSGRNPFSRFGSELKDVLKDTNYSVDGRGREAGNTVLPCVLIFFLFRA